MSVSLVNYRPSYPTLVVGVVAVSIVALLAYAFFSRKSSQQSTPKSIPPLTPIPLSSEQTGEIAKIKNIMRQEVPLVDKLNRRFAFKLWQQLLVDKGIFTDYETSAKVDLKTKVIHLNADKINRETLDKICQYMTGNIICFYDSSSASNSECHYFYRKGASVFVYIPPVPSDSGGRQKSWVAKYTSIRVPSELDNQHAANETIYNTLQKERETISFEIRDTRSAGAKI